MNIVVPVKQVPDLVEELELNQEGTDLDRDTVKYQLSEWDDQALEEALLLKEATGGQVTVITLDGDDADQILFTCLAKGADGAVKITGDFPPAIDHHTLARLLAEAIKGMDYNLILTGVQSVEDRDGQVPVLLAGYLGLPHVSVVTGVEVKDKVVVLRQEYSGGVMAEMEVSLPAVVGIQAARQAPRYAPVSKVRQMMKSAKIDEIPAGEQAAGAGLKILRLFKPEAAGRAEMLEGEPEVVVEKIVAILKERGLAL